MARTGRRRLVDVVAPATRSDHHGGRRLGRGRRRGGAAARPAVRRRRLARTRRRSAADLTGWPTGRARRLESTRARGAGHRQPGAEAATATATPSTCCVTSPAGRTRSTAGPSRSPTPAAGREHSLHRARAGRRVAALTPWNGPATLMATWKLAPALAAGNTVVLKPPEDAPLGSLHLAGLMRRPASPRHRERDSRAGGAAGAALVRHRAWTRSRSPAARRSAARSPRRAADTFKRVTLELAASRRRSCSRTPISSGDHRHVARGLPRQPGGDLRGRHARVRRPRDLRGARRGRRGHRRWDPGR